MDRLSYDEDAIFEADDSDTETVACPSCGQPVYEDADRCPKCGDWIVTSSGSKPIPFWAKMVALVLVLLFAAGLMSIW